MLTDDLVPLLIQHISSSNLVMHDAVAKAMGVWLEVHRGKAGEILDQLIATYKEKQTAPPSTSDEFGRKVVVEYHDKWEGRVGVAKAMEQVRKLITVRNTLFYAHCSSIEINNNNNIIVNCMRKGTIHVSMKQNQFLS